MPEEEEHYPVPILWLGKEDWSCNCGDKHCASLVDHPLFHSRNSEDTALHLSTIRCLTTRKVLRSCLRLGSVLTVPGVKQPTPFTGG